VAQHRRPLAAAPPAELVMFDPDDWPGPVGPVPGSNGLAWKDPLTRWADARRVFAAQHPGCALGSVLEQMRYEREVRFARVLVAP
jgi:hypothetical protein